MSNKFNNKRDVKRYEQDNNYSHNKNQNKCLKCGEKYFKGHLNSCKAVGKKCYSCGRENNLANMCCTRKSNRQKHFNKHESHNLQDESSENSSSSEVEYDELLPTMESRTLPINKIQSNSKLRHAFVMIENVKTKMMIDTGCSIDIIDKSTFMKIKENNQNIELKQTKKKLFPYASQPIKTELNQQSRKITNFHIENGTKRFKRLCYGINNSFKNFQKAVEQNFGQMWNVKFISDEMNIYNRTVEENLFTLEKIFDEMRKLNLKLKLPKFFGKSKIAFIGVELSSKGVSSDQKKIEELKFGEPPKNVSELTYQDLLIIIQKKPLIFVSFYNRTKSLFGQINNKHRSTF